MKILIIGGTKFLGKHIVQIALNKNHEVVLFNRGKTNPDLFQKLKTIVGDRNKDLSLLENLQFDAVVDTSAYFPRQVRSLLEVIKENTKNYTFISSISVYNEFETVGIDEHHPVGKIENELIEEITGETYGPLKALCEKEALSILPENTLIIRPGLIVGEDDPTDRFTYWPVMYAQSKRIVIPDRLDDKVQFIDVNDLAEWIVRLIEESVTGVFNATGPEEGLTLGELLNYCKEDTAFEGKEYRVTDSKIEKYKIQPWADLPVWIPAVGEYRGFSEVSIKKALSYGLRFRNVSETLQSTLKWYKSIGKTKDDLKTGLIKDRLSDVIKDFE